MKCTFNMATARQCLEASALAYNPVPFNSFSSALPTQINIQSSLAHAVIVEHEGFDRSSPTKIIIIAFRGTASIRDWLTDLDGLRAGWGPNGVEVHRGFLAAFTSVSEGIERALQAALQAACSNGGAVQLFITGHSLGGALALLCAKYLEALGHDVDGVYTFGQPRVGNGAFARAYDQVKSLSELVPLRERTFRFVNQEDVVPRVPGVLAGYRHAGREIFLPSSGGMEVEPPLCRKMISDAAGLWQAWRSKEEVMVGDHFITSYEAALARAPFDTLGTAEALN